MAAAPGRDPGRARLSPLVKRLLRDHGLDAGEVAGTGARGRITPTDVERTAGGEDLSRPRGRHRDTTGPRLASPLARRLLRDAGVDLTDVPGPEPITRIVAERAIDRTRTSPPGSGAAPDGDALTSTATVAVDLTRLLYGVGGIHEAVRRRTGVDLTPMAPVAHATCRALRRNPSVNAVPGTSAPAHRDVDLAVVRATADGTTVTVVPCAQDLTVTGLATRTAQPRTDTAAAGGPTFVLAGDGWGPTPRVPAEHVAPGTTVLVVETAERRPVDGIDEFGGATTSTRWLATVTLRHDPGLVAEEDARAFLADLRHELETVDQLAAVA